MGEKFKEKFSTADRKIIALIALLIGSGGGSGITALRGPNADEINAQLADTHRDVVEIKIGFARLSQKLEDYIEHSRDNRKVSLSKP